jgi:hypothetical protein
MIHIGICKTALLSPLRLCPWHATLMNRDPAAGRAEDSMTHPHRYLPAPHTGRPSQFFSFPEHEHCEQFPRHPQDGFFGDRSTLQPFGAICRPFSPLKKSRSGGTILLSKRAWNVLQPNEQMSLRLFVSMNTRPVPR